MLYFNPLIPLKTFGHAGDQRKFKYGVIGLDPAVTDLEMWKAFAFAGRLHKPVLPFIEDESRVEKAIEVNRDHAMNVAMLLNFHKIEVTEEDIATSICALSYKGDIRMRMKMENPDKVKNIVAGSKEGLRNLYGVGSKRLDKLAEQGIVKID